MPIYIPENDITIDAETDQQVIDVTVEGENEIVITIDNDAEIFAIEAKSYRDQALVYSQTAMSYRDSAHTYSDNASLSAGSASLSATSAANNAVLSESWAIGGTDTRTGEDQNNSKYYALLSGADAETAERCAQEAEDTIDVIRELTIRTTFTVNFLTGELEYVSPDITFIVNTITGNLDWEVVQ